MNKLILLIVSFCVFNGSLRAADKPNILFVIADQWRASAFGFAGDPNVQTPHREKGGKEYRGIRTTRYTYARDLQGPWLLFDDQADPYQTTNLVNQADCAKLQTELDAKLMSKLKAEGDQFLPGSEYVKQWTPKWNAVAPSSAQNEKPNEPQN